MSHKWPIVHLGEILTERRERPSPEQLSSGEIKIVDKISFNTGRMHLRSDGETKTGMILAWPGDLLVSGINAAKGAIAVYPRNSEGPVAATIHYGAYIPNEDKVDIRFLWWLLRSHFFQELLLEYVPGGIKTELKAKRLLPVPIPLPPLSEQQRIVAKMETIAMKIADAQSLRKQAAEEVEALCRAIVFNDKDVTPTRMDELVHLRKPDVAVRTDVSYQFAGVYCFGRGIFRAQLKSGIDFAYARLTRLKAGNFVYPKLMAWEGALGVVPAECDNCVVSTEFPVFEVRESRVFPEVLDVYFRTPSVWPVLSGASTGTNVRRRRLNPKDFLSYILPLPSRRTQEKLRKVLFEVNKLKILQAQTAEELDALMPSILDKAFKGQL